MIVKPSKHAMERYVERTMNKLDKQEIALYINQNEELVQERIGKLLEYADFFYEGALREGKRCNFYINKDNWVIILSKDNETVITLYKIDLGAGEEINKLFCDSLIKQIENAEKSLIDALDLRDAENIEFRERIAANESRIKDYERLIKGLKEESESYSACIKANQNSVSIIEQIIKELVEKLVCRKIF